MSAKIVFTFNQAVRDFHIDNKWAKKPTLITVHPKAWVKLVKHLGRKGHYHLIDSNGLNYEGAKIVTNWYMNEEVVIVE